MAEKVQVEGGGDFDGAILKNAATEATLDRIAKALEAKKEGSKNKVQKLFDDALKGNVKATNQTTSAQKEYTDTLHKLDRESKNVVNTLASIAGTTLGTTFSLITTAGKTLFGFFTESFDAFRDISKVGASFNNDLIELRLSAANAALPLDMFVETIKRNSQTLAALGGTVTDGAKRFGQLSKEFRESEVGETLMGMGFSMGELNDYLADQLELDMRGGKLRNKTNAELRQETQDYLIELDKLTKITGLSREQTAAGLKQAMKDGRLLSLQQKLNGQALTNFRSTVSLLNANMDPDVMGSLTNMMSGFIEPGDEFAQILAGTVPGVMEFERALGKGQLSLDEMVSGFQEQDAAITKRLAGMSDAQIAAIPALKKLREYQASIQNIINANTGEAKKQQELMSPITKALGVFSQFWTSLTSDLTTGILSSDAFKFLSEKLNDLAKLFLDNKDKIRAKLQPLIEDFMKVVGKIVEAVTDFSKAFINGDSNKSITEVFTDIFNKIGEYFKGLLDKIFGGGETPEKKAKREAYQKASPEQQAVMAREDPSLAAPETKGLFSGMIDGIKSLVGMVPSLTEFAAFFGITAGGSAVAGMGIAAGLAALAGGLQKLVAPAWELTVPVGVLGGGFWALSKAIGAIGTTIDSLKDFFKTLNEIGPGKVLELNASLTLLSGAIGGFATAGILSLISGDSLTKLFQSINKITEIDVKKMEGIGPALKALHESVSLFTGGGLLESITKTISSTGSSQAIETLIKALEPLKSLDLTNLSGIEPLTKFIDTLKTIVDNDMSQKISTGFNTIKNAIAEFIKDDKIFEKLSKSIAPLVQNNIIGEFFKSIGTLGSISIDPQQITAINSALKLLNDGISTFSSTNKNAIKNFENTINSLAKSFSTISNINLGNLDSLNESVSEIKESIGIVNSISGDDLSTLDQNIDGIKNAFTKIAGVGVDIQNTVGGLATSKITFGDDIAKQASGVDNFTKSINNLIESLQKLEVEMKKKTEVTTPANLPAGVPGATTVNTTPIAGNSPDDLQRQLNTKIDELITHIKEVKQNSKDLVDSVKGRDGALR